MFCSVCKEAAAVDATISHKNSFTSGNCQYKLESHDITGGIVFLCSFF